MADGWGRPRHTEQRSRFSRHEDKDEPLSALAARRRKPEVGGGFSIFLRGANQGQFGPVEHPRSAPGPRRQWRRPQDLTFRGTDGKRVHVAAAPAGEDAGPEEKEGSASREEHGGAQGSETDDRESEPNEEAEESGDEVERTASYSGEEFEEDFEEDDDDATSSEACGESLASSTSTSRNEQESTFDGDEGMERLPPDGMPKASSGLIGNHESEEVPEEVPEAFNDEENSFCQEKDDPVHEKEEPSDVGSASDALQTLTNVREAIVMENECADGGESALQSEGMPADAEIPAQPGENDAPVEEDNLGSSTAGNIEQMEAEVLSKLRSLDERRQRQALRMIDDMCEGREAHAGEELAAEPVKTSKEADHSGGEWGCQIPQGGDKEEGGGESRGPQMILLRLLNTHGPARTFALSGLRAYDEQGRIVSIPPAALTVRGAPPSSTKSAVKLLHSRWDDDSVSTVPFATQMPPPGAPPVELLACVPEEMGPVAGLAIANTPIEAPSERVRKVKEIEVYDNGRLAWNGSLNEVEPTLITLRDGFPSPRHLLEGVPEEEAGNEEDEERKGFDDNAAQLPSPEPSLLEGEGAGEAQVSDDSGSEEGHADQAQEFTENVALHDEDGQTEREGPLPEESDSPVKPKRGRRRGRTTEEGLKEEARLLEASLDSLSFFSLTQAGRVGGEVASNSLDEAIPSDAFPSQEASLQNRQPPVIPERPRGSILELLLHETWGDAHYVGMAGLEIFDSAGEKVQPENGITANPADINSVPGYSNDPRTPDKLIDGHESTCDELHHWLAPRLSSRPNQVVIRLGKEVELGMLRVFNYNESRIHAGRGVRVLEVLLDGETIFLGETSCANGRLESALELAESILFTEEEHALKAIDEHDRCAYEQLLGAAG